jgi:hypothetical protein
MDTIKDILLWVKEEAERAESIRCFEEARGLKRVIKRIESEDILYKDRS